MRYLMLCIVVLVASATVLAQTASPNSDYPFRTDPYVNDLGGVLSPLDEETLRDLVESIAPSFDMTVLTIDTIADFDSSKPSIETFSTNVFNRWGIGTQANNKGVLIVLAIKNRDVRIEIGDGYGRDYDNDLATIIQEYMLPRFREGKYARGLIDGTGEIHELLTGTVATGLSSAIQSLPTPRPSTTYYPANTRSNGLPQGMLPLAIGGTGVAGIAGAALLEQYPKTWRTQLKALKKLNWARTNAGDWEGRAMLHGRISKASTNVQLTAIFIKQALGVKLSEDDKLIEASRTRN